MGLGGDDAISGAGAPSKKEEELGFDEIFHFNYCHADFGHTLCEDTFRVLKRAFKPYKWYIVFDTLFLNTSSRKHQHLCKYVNGLRKYSLAREGCIGVVFFDA